MSGRTPPPPILPLMRDTLPLADLAPYAHCVSWRLEWRSPNGKPGGWTKPPINPLTGDYARSNDPATWATADAVLAHSDHFGFVVAEDDPFTFIDIDDGADPGSGEAKPWARAIIDRFPMAYWERSPSGSGYKGLLRGKPARNFHAAFGDGKIEVYFSGKFTTLTGHRLPASAPSIGDGQAALDTLYAETCSAAAPSPTPNPSPILDEREIIERVLRMPKGRQLHRDGDISGFPSGSEADLALLNCYIAAGATNDGELDQLFRQSALYERDDRKARWEDARYRDRTINKALDGTVTPWDGWNGAETGADAPKPQDAVLGASDDLPDDIATLKAMIRDLTRRVEAAEARTAAAERRAEMLSRVQSTTARIIGNRDLGQERFTAVALAHRFAHLESRGDAADDGLHRITLNSVADVAGVSVDAASRHIAKLADLGAIRKDVRWVAPHVDQRTGEIIDRHRELYLGPTGGSVLQFVEAVAAARPEAPKTWGGRADRCRPCPDHPDAAIVKRVTYHCAECGAELGHEPDTVLDRSEDGADAPKPHLAVLGERTSEQDSVDTPLSSYTASRHQDRILRFSDNHADYSGSDAAGTPVEPIWLANETLPRPGPAPPDRYTDVTIGGRAR